jgi:hypothetical protein
MFHAKNILGISSLISESRNVCFFILIDHDGSGVVADWGTGNQLLSVCKSLLCTHANAVLLGPLGDVLMAIWSSFDNIDIADHGETSHV